MKSCFDCGYCKEHFNYIHCTCYERIKEKGTSTIKDTNEAATCKYYDDESWIK